MPLVDNIPQGADLINVNPVPVLINENMFKQFSPVKLNFNWSQIRPFVNVAEMVWIKTLLGQSLYDELIEQVNHDGEEPIITEDNKLLLQQVYQYEGLCIVYEALPFIAFKFTEKGLTRGKSDNSEPVDTTDINYLSTQIRAQVEVNKKMLKEWLMDNKDKYPLWKDDDDECRCVFNPQEKPNRYQIFYKTPKCCIDIF